MTLFPLAKIRLLAKPARLVDEMKEPGWKKALDESLAEAESGKGQFFASDEEFIGFLSKESRKAGRTEKSRELSRKSKSRK